MLDPGAATIGRSSLLPLASSAQPRCRSPLLLLHHEHSHRPPRPWPLPPLIRRHHWFWSFPSSCNRDKDAQDLTIQEPRRPAPWISRPWPAIPVPGGGLPTCIIVPARPLAIPIASRGPSCTVPNPGHVVPRLGAPPPRSPPAKAASASSLRMHRGRRRDK